MALAIKQAVALAMAITKGMESLQFGGFIATLSIACHLQSGRQFTVPSGPAGKDRQTPAS